MSFHTATQLCLLLVEGSDTFLILLVLIWFSLQVFLLILSKAYRVFLHAYPGEAEHQEQVIPMWGRRWEWGKGKIPAVPACSGLSCCDTMFVVAFYGLLPACNHYEGNINLVSWKIGRNSWTSSGLAVFVVKGGRIHFTTLGNIRMLCYVKTFFCVGNGFVKHYECFHSEFLCNSKE